MVTYNDFILKLREFEGCRLTAYRCPSGVLTVGYGHTHGVFPGMHITHVDAISFLEYDLTLVTYEILRFHPDFVCDKNFGLFLALKSFIFNVGVTKYKNSTLRRIIDSIDLSQPLSELHKSQLSIQFLLWTKSKGRTLKGLEKRRQWEISLFMND